MAALNLFSLLNGLTFAALLFLVAAGFTLIFGLLRIVNLAHGAIYLAGGYMGYSAAVLSGSFALGVPIPPVLSGAARFAGVYYPRFRLFVLALGVVVFCGLWLLLRRTRLGALIRAGVDDTETISAMGVDIQRIFLITFLLGTPHVRA